MMRRVPEVLDCWFESGSMPFAQVHYPFENADWFEHHYPGDFIVEYIGQTRGWFYTLHVLATALFDRPAFRTCVSHGIVLGDDGLKMSKSLRNYPDPMEVFDTLRRRRDALVPAVVADPARRRLLGHRGRASATPSARCCCRCGTRGTSSPSTPTPPATTASGAARTRAEHVLDRYVLAKTRELVDDVTRGDGRLRPVRRLRRGAVVPRRADQLVRPPQPRPVLGRRRRRHRHAAHRARRARARRRAAAAAVDRGDLRGLTGAHAAACTSPTGPTPTSCRPTPSWSSAMDQVRDVCSAALSVRKANGLRVRQPLASLTVAVPGRRRAGAVRRPHRRRGQREARSSSPTTSAPVAGQVLQVVPAALGPRLGKQTQQVIKAVKAGDWTPRRRRGRRRRALLEPASTRCSWSPTATGRAPTLGRRQRRRRARHRRHARARAGGPGPRPGPPGAAGPARRRPGRHRPHRAVVTRRADVGRRRARPRGADRRRDAGVDRSTTDDDPASATPPEIDRRAWRSSPAVRSTALERLPASPDEARRPHGRAEEGRQTKAARAKKVRTGQGRRRPPRRRAATTAPAEGAGQEGAGRRPRRPRRPATARPDIPAPRGTTKDGIAYTKDFDVKFLKAQHDLLLAERARRSPARPSGSRTRPTR